MKTISIRIRSNIIKGKTNTFLKYSFVNSDHKYFRVKFTKNCIGSAPTEEGWYSVSVSPDDLGLTKGHPVKKGDKEYQEEDTLWIRNCESVTRDTAYEEEVRKNQRDSVLTQLFPSGEIE